MAQQGRGILGVIIKMPIDEVRFGELIGTVGALVTAVADMKAAIIPALHAQQKEMELHKETDAVMNAMVVDIATWKDGKNGEKGAKRILEELEKNKIKAASFIGGVALAGGAAGHKISDLITKLWG